jgi:hypothetical protein
VLELPQWQQLMKRRRMMKLRAVLQRRRQRRGRGLFC